MDVISGNGSSVWIDFIGQTGSLVPDAGVPVTYSLFNQNGSAILSNQPLTLAADATGAMVTVNPLNNTINSSRLFEKRIITINMTSGGQSQLFRAFYRLIPLPVFTASAEDVRSYIGLGSDELTDEEVDIFSAYLKLADGVTKSTLDGMLISGTLDEINANKAIVAQAVIDVFSSLQLRALKSKSNGSDSVTRFGVNVDLSPIRDQAQTDLDVFFASLAGATTQTEVTIVRFVGPTTDPITGA